MIKVPVLPKEAGSEVKAVAVEDKAEDMAVIADSKTVKAVGVISEDSEVKGGVMIGMTDVAISESQ